MERTIVLRLDPPPEPSGGPGPTELLRAADRVEAIAPGVQVLSSAANGTTSNGAALLCLRIRGPARFYGGEDEAARAILGAAGAGPGGGDGGRRSIWRAGIADGRFAAEQAARVAGRSAGIGAGVSAGIGSGTPARLPIVIVPPGESPGFLAPLSVAALAESSDAGTPDLPELLIRLGVYTLGDFAALPAAAVLDRFGPIGARLQELSSGRDGRRTEPRVLPPELGRELSFEPPLELAEQVAFAVRVAAEEFVAGLVRQRLACTELRIGLLNPDGETSERSWVYSAAFDAATIVDRVRWQLDSAELSGGVALVRLAPESVDPIGEHEPGLFGGPDQRIEHAVARVQAMLGPGSVVTAAIGGGRRPAGRAVLTPWGERPPRLPRADRTDRMARTDRTDRIDRTEPPWPGSLPAPHPASVYSPPRPVQVISDRGGEVRIDDRGVLGAEPAALVLDGRRRRLTAWAGPWPLVEHTWRSTRRAHRFQVVDETGAAWLLLLESGSGARPGDWVVEAGYD